MQFNKSTIILVSMIMIIVIVCLALFGFSSKANTTGNTDIDSNSTVDDSTTTDADQNVVDVDVSVVVIPDNNVVVTPPIIDNNTNVDNNTAIDTNTTPTVPTFTSAQVATHKTRSDCYMIISGKVYDFSTYISKHPGGSVMVGYCGKDGTSELAWHSRYANSLYQKYYVGELQ